ncbi:DUF4198 domain-containing protein [Hymenobacter yonginensis]|uniref:DUF4198 domain-containing protein n=1 Tax=Hymenobacter yonginensis TaxID=748197 RepID=A0ABY7PJJ6_9BACT|nr:DUF4198 domain-containing protein [Hymenobacter yonginensis]WBO82906.1 DUF4198 domain-containing protein [Hymenobacter yonginensis]
MRHSFRFRFRVCLLAGVCLLGGTTLAREFWLQPAQFFVAPGTSLALRVFVGENFTGERWAGKSSRVTRLTHFAPSGPHDLLPAATTADTLHAALTFQEPGTHLVALATNNTSSTLEASQFNTYLKQQGLDYILLERQKRGTLNQPGREAYRRCATTLVQAGAPAALDTARAWSRPTGLPLELVPEQNPYTLKAGASLTVRVLAEGLPQAGQLVQVWQRSPGQPVRISKLYSNQNGRVLLRLSGAGTFMLSTVRMVPATLPEADWQSTWASLSFGFRPLAAR